MVCWYMIVKIMSDMVNQKEIDNHHQYQVLGITINQEHHHRATCQDNPIRHFRLQCYKAKSKPPLPQRWLAARARELLRREKRRHKRSNNTHKEVQKEEIRVTKTIPGPKSGPNRFDWGAANLATTKRQPSKRLAWRTTKSQLSWRTSPFGEYRSSA